METKVLEVISPTLTNIQHIFFNGYAKIKVKFVQLFHYLSKNITQTVASLLVLYFILLLFSIVFSNNKTSLQSSSFPIVQNYQPSLRNGNLKESSTYQQKKQNQLEQLLQQQGLKCFQTIFPNLQIIEKRNLRILCELIEGHSNKLQNVQKQNNPFIQEDDTDLQINLSEGQIMKSNMNKDKLLIKYQQIFKQFESEEERQMIGKVQIIIQSKQNRDVTLNFLSQQQRQIIIQNYLKKKDDSQTQYLQNLTTNQRVQQNQSQKDINDKAQLTKKFKIKNYQEINGLCIILTVFNNAQNHQIVRTLNSIYNQIYQNYNVIIVDRFSTDNTVQLIQNYLKQNPKFSQSTKIAKHKKLAEVQATFSGLKQCNKGDLAILMNGNSQILTRQAFMLIDYMYQKRQITVLYSDTYELDLTRRQINLYKGGFYDTSQKFMNLYRDLPRKYGSFFTFDTKLLKFFQKSFLINSDGKWFKYSANQALKITILQLSCGDIYHLKEPIFLNQLDSQANEAFQTKQQQEWRAISRKNKSSICQYQSK